MKAVNIPLAFCAAAFAFPVFGAGAERPTNFIRDVMPVLNRTGCTSGACHGSAKGKNGFKLSLRGYDPEFDYRRCSLKFRGGASTAQLRPKA